MKRKKNFKLKSLLLLFLLVGSQLQAQQSAIFPQPNEVVVNSDLYILNNTIRYVSTPEIEAIINVVRPQFRLIHALEFKAVAKDSAVDLRFQQLFAKTPEHYNLKIDKKGILIEYGDKNGLIYGLQSLDQYLENKTSAMKIRGVNIFDQPKFSYRGVHLDCSRHFFTVTEIKGLLDQMMHLKLNRFHWHLTDDQGWRLEIKQYPKLTEIGAWRDSTVIGHYSRKPREYDHKKYGGFYTQEEAKEIVHYAAARGITVVPEIELPGHARAALAAYPELGCTGEQLPVEGLWGVFDDVFCTQPETIDFLKNVLKEVIAIFPSETIHIGGDECPKTRWDVCPKCQKVRTENGLHDSHELQSYVIREMEAFLRANGRKLMGWDEILEGGLADNAQVMSWRGTEGGIAAAKQQHPVVMTPGSHCYFDHYQSTHPDEPLAIGGYTPLEKVYQFDPIPASLTTEEQQYILGAQANIWTEYLPDMNAVEYNTFPRLIAMSQVLWTIEKPNYSLFVPMLVQHYLPRLEKYDIHYSTAFLDPTVTLSPQPSGLNYELDNSIASILVDGKPARSILLTKTQQPELKKISVECNYQEKIARTMNYTFTTHRIIGKPVHFITLPSKSYNYHDSLGLTDGVRGTLPWKGNQWLGFANDTVQFSIYLGELTEFDTLELGCLLDDGSWIYLPKTILIETSMNGKKFKRAKEQAVTSSSICVNKKIKANYLRITLINNATIPAGKPGAGNTPWTFIDELIIR